MKGLCRPLLALVAAGALSTAPVAVAGGPNGGGIDHGGNNGGPNGNGKTTICHATGSETNPYVLITISNNALDAHARHQDGEDIIPAPAKGCPTGKGDDDGKDHDCDKKDDGGKKHGKKHRDKKHRGKKHGGH
jgi:hypothetical protein